MTVRTYHLELGPAGRGASPLARLAGVALWTGVGVAAVIGAVIMTALLLAAGVLAAAVGLFARRRAPGREPGVIEARRTGADSWSADGF